MNSRIRAVFFLLSFLAILVGCSNQPSSSDAKRDAEEVARADIPSEAAFSVADLVRENGWDEGGEYKIHFTYNLITTVDYPNLVVALLKKSVVEIKAMPKADRSALVMQVGLTSMLSGMSSDAPDVKAELDSYKNFPAIIDYIRGNKDFQDDSELLVSATYLTTNVLRDYNIRQGIAASTKIPRQVTFTYRKTEKGWQKVS